MPHAATVLVYSRTTGYRHDSIPVGVATVRELAEAHGFATTATEDPAAFTERLRAGCATVVFLSTSGEVLDAAGRDALRGHVRDGGGFMGVHAASTTEYGWPWYGRLLGARFTRHPEPQPALVTVVDRDHPATAHLPERWAWTDEWYDFAAGPGPRARVLLGVDETTYAGGGMGADHPIAWCLHHDGGRAFYTALGHAADTYADPLFRRHLLGGLRWSAGATG